MEDNILRKQPEMVPFKKRYSAFIDRYLGILISISIHLVLLAFLSYIIFYTPVEKMQFSNINASELKIPKLDIKLPDEIKIEKVTNEIPSDEVAETEQRSSESASAKRDPISSSAPPSKFFELGTTSSAPGFGDGFISLGDSALAGGISSGNAFSYRKSRKQRSETNLEKQSDAIVVRTLNYLKRVQNEDGSWGDAGDNDLRNALTSLAVLTFLAYGEDTATPLFGDTVRAALRFLQKQGEARNADNPNSFGEALMTYALAEGASISQIPELLDATSERIRRIRKKISLQNNAWEKGSLSTWNYQALKAAAFAVDQKDFDTFVKQTALQLLQYHRKQSEALGKQVSLNELNDIFSRTYSLQLFGYAKHQTVSKYFSYALRHNRGFMLDCNWNTNETWPLYNWYYRTNAIFSSESNLGTNWNKWSKTLVDTLRQHQNSNGSFVSPEIAGAYNQSGENIPTFKSERNLTVYSTSLCALMLQTKYRYRESYFNSDKKETTELIPPEISFKTGTAALRQKLRQ